MRALGSSRDPVTPPWRLGPETDRQWPGLTRSSLLAEPQGPGLLPGLLAGRETPMWTPLPSGFLSQHSPEVPGSATDCVTFELSPRGLLVFSHQEAEWSLLPGARRWKQSCWCRQEHPGWDAGPRPLQLLCALLVCRTPELTSLGFLETGSEVGRLKHLEDVTDTVRRDVSRPCAQTSARGGTGQRQGTARPGGGMG